MLIDDIQTILLLYYETWQAYAACALGTAQLPTGRYDWLYVKQSSETLADGGHLVSNQEVRIVTRKEAYVIEFSDTAFKHFRRYPKHVRRRIMWRLRQLAADPFSKSNVKHVYLPKCPYRLRVGKYRVLYRLDDQIRLVDILPRKKVYSKYRFDNTRRTA